MTTMTIRSLVWNRILRWAGLVCLATTLLLNSAVVRSVRAEDDASALMTVDPALVPHESPISEGPPAELGGPVAEERGADVIQLNMSGYNYDNYGLYDEKGRPVIAEPGTLSPAALNPTAKSR